jgi:molybdopterin converting factor small subunit
LSFSHWKDTLNAVRNELQKSSTKTDTKDLILVDLNLHDDMVKDLVLVNNADVNSSDTKIETADELEGSSSKKQKKTEADTNQSVLNQLNQSLEELYQSLPSNTTLLIFTQKNLKDMRKLMAKKIRYECQRFSFISFVFLALLLSPVDINGKISMKKLSILNRQVRRTLLLKVIKPR